MSARAAVRRAIFNRLSASSALAAAGWAVFDAIPPNPGTRYVVVGRDATETPEDAGFGAEGHSNTETLHFYAKVRGSPLVDECHDIIKAALTGSTLMLDGHTALTLRFQFYTQLEEGEWRHGVARYGVWSKVAA
jgi:hypothetical protein